MSQVCWTPPPERVRSANINRFIQLVRSELDPAVVSFDSLYDLSISSPEAFWRATWDFFQVRGKRGARVLADGDRMPGARWFPDAQLNFAENLLRRRDDSTAIIFTSEAGFSREMSYSGLYRQVAGTAAALKAAGVQRGDRVAFTGFWNTERSGPPRPDRAESAVLH
jgi:acetoacetyl-CoA synthetase